MIIDTNDHPIVVSVLYYAFFLSSGSILRSTVRRFIAEQNRQYWLDLVTTFSVLACSLENSHVRNVYGYSAYFVVIFLLGTWYSMTTSGCNYNPAYSVVAYAKGQYDLVRLLWLTSAQVLGACLSYRGAFIFWTLGLCKIHRKRAEGRCNTELNVPATLGFLIESSGMALNVILRLCVFTSSTQIELTVKRFFTCLLTVHGG